MLPNPNNTHPIAELAREDLDFIVEFVRRSGSLKDVAASYGVSYPTIRARLDRLIERVEQAVSGQKPDPVSSLLADLVERGELGSSTARAIREVVRAMNSKGDVP